MKYLKYFETEAGYASYKNGSDYVLPNVSYIEDVKDIRYDSISFENKNIICTYIIDEYSVNTPIKLIHCTDCLFWDDAEKNYPIIIDGVSISDDDLQWEDRGCSYVFNSIGIHTVEFIPSIVEVEENEKSFTRFETGYYDAYNTNYPMFMDCSNLNSVKIPNVAEHITVFYATFANCTSLKEIDLSENVEHIGSFSFQDCCSLSNIIIRSTTPPEITKDTFYIGDIGTSNYTINVPSIDNYQTWANNTNSYYPGYYSKIKFENI